MLSLAQMYEILESNKDKEMSTAATSLLLHGKNMKSQTNFWNDFIQICNNSEGLSELLDVPRDKVALWGNKIQSALNNLDSAIKNDSSIKVKTNIIDTGN